METRTLELHERLARLFQGRIDVYGAIHGECVKEPLTAAVWAKHVYGDGSVGVYPLIPRLAKSSTDINPHHLNDEFFVRWGCIDIDEGYDEGLVIAKNLHLALKHLGITAWIERTKGKGYHVWVLCSDWVPAVQMRAVQILACELIGYRPKEINPKQVTLAEGQLGNYVNVPYAKKWSDEGTRVVLHPDDWAPMTIGAFLNVAEWTLNSPEKIAEVAAIFRPPPEKKPVVIEGYAAPAEFAPKMSPLLRHVYAEGPLEGKDRSGWLQKLAHMAYKDGFEPVEALYLVMLADQRVGKYVGRADRERQLERIIENAYG